MQGEFCRLCLENNKVLTPLYTNYEAVTSAHMCQYISKFFAVEVSINRIYKTK